MLKYVSHRHQKLMDASEYALRDAVESPSERDARVATSVIANPRTHHSWELWHADLLLPAARHGSSRRQLLELRKAEVQLAHRRAFFRYLSENEIRGDLRTRLFRLHHRTLDFENAVLVEHRQYLLAESSRISTDYIIDLMDDVVGQRLLRQYEKLYNRHFELKCYIAMARDRTCVDLVRPLLDDVQIQLSRVRTRLASEPPDTAADFERQEALARSGRYEAINYMVG